MRLVLKLLISAAVIFGLAYFSDGSLLVVEGPTAALWAAIALALVNLVVKPIVKLVALPVTVITLGLFSLVINAFMLYIVSWVVPGVDTAGFFSTVIAALIISVVTSVLTWFIDKD